MRICRKSAIQDQPRCATCGAEAVFRSRMSGKWLCSDCNPCWCHWCNGRVGVHGEKAVALYRLEAEVAMQELGQSGEG